MVVSNKLTLSGRNISVTPFTVVVVETSQPFASVTVTEYNPGLKFEIFEFVLLNPAGPVQLMS